MKRTETLSALTAVAVTLMGPRFEDARARSSSKKNNRESSHATSFSHLSRLFHDKLALIKSEKLIDEIRNGSTIRYSPIHSDRIGNTRSSLRNAYNVDASYWKREELHQRTRNGPTYDYQILSA